VTKNSHGVKIRGQTSLCTGAADCSQNPASAFGFGVDVRIVIRDSMGSPRASDDAGYMIFDKLSSWRVLYMLKRRVETGEVRRANVPKDPVT
jgi:hypothetical protein